MKITDARRAIATSVFLTLILSVGFAAVEPTLGRSASAEDQFEIHQTITAEISFAAPASDVTMNGSIAGTTGGSAYGTTSVRVATNNNLGFTMTVQASSSPAMQREGGGDSINDYTPATAGIPDYTFSVPSGAEFGFTVSASTTGELAQKFKDDGFSTCNWSGGVDTSSSASCWMGLSTTATSTIVTTGATAASGATSTMVFRTFLNSGSGKASGTYTATTTLTATTN